jgi:hypothetical protein
MMERDPEESLHPDATSERVREATLWTIGTVTVKWMSGLDLDLVVWRGQTIRYLQGLAVAVAVLEVILVERLSERL